MAVIEPPAAAPAALAPGGRYAGWMLNVARASTVATAASLPFSTAATNVFMVFAFLFWALSGRWRDTVRAIAAEPAAWWGCLLTMLLWLGVTWSQVSVGDAAGAIEKYRELALFGIVMALFTDRAWRGRALAAFFFATLALLLISYGIRFGWIHYVDPRGAGARDNAVFLRNPITHGFIMSVLAYGSAVAALRAAGWRRWGFALVAVAAAANVWLGVQGRTGYVVLAVLLLWLAASRWSVRGLAVAVVGLAVLIGAIYAGVPSFQARVDKAFHEAAEYRAVQKDTSIGLRLHFWRRSLQWLSAHPALGAGTGAWGEAFYEATANDPPFFHSRTHQHPHNEYVNLSVQLGPAGFVLLAGLFLVAFRRAGELPPEEARLAQGLVIAMAVGCLFNDLIWDMTEGHMWAVLGGVLFGASRVLPTRMR